MATFSPFSSLSLLCLIVATLSYSISAEFDVAAIFAQAVEQTKNITGDASDPTTLNVSKNVADEIITAAASAVNDTDSGLGDVISGAASALNKTVDGAESAVNNTVKGADDIVGGATSAVNSTVNGADGVIDGATSAVNDTKGDAEDVVDGTKQIAGDHSGAPSTTAFSAAQGTASLLVFAVIGWSASPVLF